jgi:hypothetical protein
MTVLSLRARQDYLEKVASTRDPIKAVSEFVWNAVDAEATHVAVEFVLNPLGGIQEIVIRDNGTGITHAHAGRDFGNLGDSWKRTSLRTPQLHRALHGKEGRGRLRFFSLAERARWGSVYSENGKRWAISIEIASGALERSDLSEASESASPETGTVVTLTRLKAANDWLLTRKAFLEFSTLFAPYIMQYPDVTISYDGNRVDPNATILKSSEFPKQTIVGPNRTVRDLTIRIIEWKSQVDDRKIHLGGESGIILGSQPAHVTAPGFDFSAYAYAAYFQEVADANLLELDDLSDPDLNHVMVHIREQLTDYFRERQAERSRGLIDDLKSAGAYPYEGEPKDDVERRERQMFDIATHAVSSYSRDFKKAETSVKRMTLTLLREAVRHNPDGGFTVEVQHVERGH